MIIKNGLVYDEQQGFVSKTLYLEQGRFCDSTGEGEIIDAGGCYVIPGLIDIHFHGCDGADFSDGNREALDRITAYQFAHGVTSICPASLTLSRKDLTSICEAACDWNQSGDSREEKSRLIALQLEGPFVSYEKRGAQNPDYIIPASLSLLEELYEASGGLVKLLAIAPETEGAIDFISQVKAHDQLKNIHLSLAHTTANYETAKQAFEAGADHVTHLFNAMPPFHHRDPGVIGAAFDTKNCYAELICDGVHIHPSVVRAAFAMFTRERIVLISDSMRAAGLSDGDYTLGGQRVHVQGRQALLENGSLAGSVSNLMDCVRTVVSMGIPLEDAIACATIHPARSIGMEQDYGSLEPGKVGDCVILDKDLNIKKVIKGRL